MNRIFAGLIGAALLLPGIAFANGIVVVDTTIQNVNGGTLDYKGLGKTQLVTPQGAYSQYGTPSFFIPAGGYQVIFNPPQGYTESHDANCSGGIADGETIHCHVTYTDGTPVEYGTPAAAAPVVTAPVVPVSTTTVATSTASTTASLTPDQVSAILNVLAAFGVDQATINLIASYL